MNTETPFEIAGYRVEPSTLMVNGPNGENRLESKVMQVLVYLVEQAGKVVGRDELEQHIWAGRIVTDDAVTNAIGKLRRALGDNARDPRVIETIPKTGYRLIANITPVTEADDGLPETSIARFHERWKLFVWVVGSLLILLLFLLARGLLVETGPTSVVLSGKPSVAILPFDNLNASPEQDYFANGITADLITDLSRISGLLVIAPGTVFAYRGSDVRPSQISAELHVDYVVLGNVQRSGQRLRVNVQLIEAINERALWGERYEGSMDDIFTIQDRLTTAVIDALKVEINPREHEYLTRQPTASVVAYDYLLKGLDAHAHRTKEQNQLAKEYFGQAIELDPSFARAYSGLAMVHSRDAIDGWTQTPSRSLELAEQLVQKAESMDSTLPQVHFVSGQIALFQHRHLRAIEATQRAIQVDPNYADAYALRAWILNYAGRPDEAEIAMSEAMRINSRSPGAYLEVLGEILFVQGRYDESVLVFERVLDINPNYTRARMWNAAALILNSELDRAEWEVAELLLLIPDFSLARMEYAFPFKDPRILGILLDGLRKAGLPE